MNSIKSIGKKLSSGTVEIYSSLRESFRSERSERLVGDIHSEPDRDNRTYQPSLESEVREVRRILNEELKLEREARDIIRRRSTAHSLSTASSYTAYSAPSRTLSVLETPRHSLMSFDEDLFADFQANRDVLSEYSAPVHNPFVDSVREIEKIEEIASSLSELSDSALKSVVSQLLIKRPSAMQPLKEALN